MIVKIICRGPIVRGPRGYCEEGYTVTHDDGSTTTHAHPGYGDNLDADAEAYTDIRAWLKAGGVLTEDPEAVAAVYVERKLAREMFFALAEAEKDDLRWEIEQLKKLRLAPVIAEPAQPEPPLLPAPDALMSDYGPVGDDITGDMLLDAFELDEAETVAVVQTLSALRLKHLSEQLNVERARLDREHQATGVANPRSASIDRLLGLLTRRGEV